MEIHEIVLKVDSICNLNCEYCYVFNQGDTTHLLEPNIIEEDLPNIILSRVNEYCKIHKLKDFYIIFHGGEPLLLPQKFYIDFVKKSQEIVKNVDLHFLLQTNGTLLNNVWAELLVNLGITVGVSIDGTEEATKRRVYKSTGKPAFNEILKGLKVLQKYQEETSILTVANVNYEPKILYEFYKSIGINGFDLLLPDATHEKKGDAVGRLGEWLSCFFDIWYDDKDEKKPDLRIFDVILRLLLGFDIGNEPWGLRYNGVVALKPSGKIEPVDSLKICGHGITETNLNIRKNTLDDVVSVPLIRKYYNAHQDSELCSKCCNCIIKHICGGSQLAHRYSIQNEFDNPSVYCNDIRVLVTHIQNRLVADMPELKDAGVELLTEEDFN